MAKLYYRHAAMQAGKSTYLLQIVHNYERNGSKVLLFTCKSDTRTPGEIHSRLGISRPAQLFDAWTDFLTLLPPQITSEVKCVLIDEAQFLTKKQVKELHEFCHTKNGIPVICFGLRSDFRGNPFEGSAMLLALADDMEELKTICECGRKATMNMRYNSQTGHAVFEGDQIAIEGTYTPYKSVCADCFYAEKARYLKEKEN